MSLTIATASQVLVLRCNYHDLQWSEAKTCRVQLVKQSGDYILKIGRRKDGRVSRAPFLIIIKIAGSRRCSRCLILHQIPQKITEYKLSKEAVKIHFCKGAGFIQVLLTAKVLYGIKFSNDVEGDKFYTKLIETIGK